MKSKCKSFGHKNMKNGKMINVQDKPLLLWADIDYSYKFSVFFMMTFSISFIAEERQTSNLIFWKTNRSSHNVGSENNSLQPNSISFRNKLYNSVKQQSAEKVRIKVMMTTFANRSNWWKNYRFITKHWI